MEWREMKFVLNSVYAAAWLADDDDVGWLDEVLMRFNTSSKYLSFIANKTKSNRDWERERREDRVNLAKLN